MFLEDGELIHNQKKERKKKKRTKKGKSSYVCTNITWGVVIFFFLFIHISLECK